MFDWKPYIRAHLAPLALSAEREMEIVEELSEHLEDRYAELLARGLAPDEAQRVALADLAGGGLLTKDLGRVERKIEREPVTLGARRANMLGDLWQDLRFGLRMLRKNPGFTLVAALALALGIGANTAIFSVTSAVLLSELPYEEPERLVHPVAVHLARGIERGSIPYADFADWRDDGGIFELIALYQRQNPTLTDGQEPERVAGLTVSEGYFELMKAQAIAGRTFRAEDHQPGAERVAVISRGLWQRRYGGDQAIIGRTLRISGTPYTIIGVVEQDSVWPDAIDLWGTINLDAIPAESLLRRDNMTWQAIARLKSGVTLEQARARMATMARRVEQEHPESRRGVSMDAIPLRDFIVGPQFGRAIAVLMGAVAFMLLIACANVANLLLARSAAREREIAIRAALGAGRLRILRQLLAESLLLAALGGALGLLLGALGLKGLIALAPDGIPRLESVSIDAGVLAFTAAMTIATAVVFGLLPALNLSRLNQSESLKEGAHGASGSRPARRLRSLLAVSEIAISIVLLVGAGLMSRSFFHLQNVDPGVRVDDVLTFRLSLPAVRYAKPEEVTGFYRRLEERLRAVPGVESVASTSKLPIGGPGFGLGRVFLREGQPEPPASADFPAQWTVITPDYFRTMGIPLLKGRAFTDEDRRDSNPVIIISRSMAERFFPGEDPLGKRIRSWRDENLLREVVGVVGDVRYRGLEDDQRSLIYVPHEQTPWGFLLVAVRASGDPMSFASVVRKEVKSLDRELAVSNLATMASIRDDSLASSRFNALLLAVFAAVALIMASVGIYGVMAYAVTQRRHEIGIRLALGASPVDILRTLLSEGARLTIAGMTVGLLAAVAAARALAGLLYGVSTADPATFAGIALLLGGVSLIACYLPARRAMRVNPIIALRQE